MKFSTAVLPLLVASSVSAFGINVGGNIGKNQETIKDASLKVPGENPLDFCADPKDWIATITNVDLTPNPPERGQNLSIKATGKLSEDIEEGAVVHLQVKFGLIRLINDVFDFCEQVKNIDMKCPIKKDDDIQITKEVTLPKEIPPGKFTVLADVYTKDERKITCLTATVVFRPR